MDIKIPSGLRQGSAVDSATNSVEQTESAREAVPAEKVEGTSGEGVERIAAQVMAGEIGREEAVERLLGEVLDSDMVKAAPEALREELAEVLEALLETDPHLRSLAAAIGPKKSE